MAVQYRKLTEKELENFIKMRICQLRDEGAKEDIDLKPALMDYYNRHMADGTFVSWIAVDGDKIVGNSKRIIGTGCKGSERIWMRQCTNNSFRYGSYVETQKKILMTGNM